MSQPEQRNRPWAWVDADGRPVMSGLSPEVPQLAGHTFVASQPPSMQHTWRQGQWVPPSDSAEQE